MPNGRCIRPLRRRRWRIRLAGCGRAIGSGLTLRRLNIDHKRMLGYRRLPEGFW
jgi:hypothetical protein